MIEINELSINSDKKMIKFTNFPFSYDILPEV